MPRTIIFAIDVEPDGRAQVARDDNAGLSIALGELRALRNRFEAVSQGKVCFNWFLRFDPQTLQIFGRLNWIPSACPDVLSWIRACGDYTGVHTHFWRWDSKQRRWFTDFADVDWCAHCLHTSIEGHAEVFGRRPEASRFGDRCLSNALIASLKKEGIRYDLTIEPGIPDAPFADDPHASAWLPDYRRAPRLPYRPSSRDFLTPEVQQVTDSGSDLWMVPLTTTNPPKLVPVRRFPFFMKSSRCLNLVLRPQAVWEFLEQELAHDRAEPLVMVLRAGDLGNSRFLANFRYVASHLAGCAGLSGSRFVGVDEAVRTFATNGAAPAASARSG